MISIIPRTKAESLVVHALIDLFYVMAFTVVYVMTLQGTNIAAQVVGKMSFLFYKLNLFAWSIYVCIRGNQYTHISFWPMYMMYITNIHIEMPKYKI